MENEKKQKIQEEVLRIILPLHRCGVGLSMGVGKTLIGLKHMVENFTEGVKFLVVGPKNSVFDTWKEEADKWGLGYLIPHITFTTYLSLSNQDPDKEVVYLDECHSLLETHDYWLSRYGGKILGLSGTPPRYENSEKGKMVAKYCPIVYKYDTDEAITDEILNDYQIIVHMVNLNPIKSIPMHKNGATWFTSEQAAYDYWGTRLQNASTQRELQMMRVMRMKAIQGFKSKEIIATALLKVIKDKVVLFADTQDQADRLCQYSYHSKNPKSEENLEMLKSGKIKQMSCVLQLNEGVNIPDLKEEIIMHAYGNERKASQRIGRGLRLEPGEVATIHILCYKNTIDETWVKQALQGFDQSKIKYV